MDFFNIFCLTIFLFICYLIIDFSQIEDKFILVINDDDEEPVKATNYNSVNEATADVKEKNDDINILQEQIDDKESVKATICNFVKDATADSVKEKNMKGSYEIERIRKESLLLRQENDRVRNKYLHLKKENERNFTNLEHSSDITKNERKKRILLDLEIERLLNKLNLIDLSLAYRWCQGFKYESDIEIIESKIKDLDKFIH
ncbi:19082_t:CDS:1, partial [Gigaspora margarita]